jgi:hypothetical protein
MLSATGTTGSRIGRCCDSRLLLLLRCLAVIIVIATAATITTVIDVIHTLLYAMVHQEVVLFVSVLSTNRLISNVSACCLLLVVTQSLMLWIVHESRNPDPTTGTGTLPVVQQMHNNQQTFY